MITLQESQQSFNDKVMNEYLRQLNNNIKKNADKLLNAVVAETEQIFTSSEIYRSLVTGELAAHFGFYKNKEEARVRPILNRFLESFHYEFVPFKKRGGKFAIRGIRADFQDVFGLPEALINGKNRSKFSTKYPLPWLEWLLKAGDSVLVDGYRIKLGSFNSRSGRAIMVESGSYKVPASLKDGTAGTLSDNWVTKEVLSTQYERMLNRLFKEFIHA
jgi:hypothetical protein